MVRSHDEGRDGRSVIETHGSAMGAQNKSVTGGTEMQQVGTEV